LTNQKRHVRQLFRREDLDCAEVRKLLQLFYRLHLALYQDLVAGFDRDIGEVGQAEAVAAQDTDDENVETAAKAGVPNEL